jgi:hypothetical protein
MKGWIGWVLLGLTLVIAVIGWRNAQPEPETETLARKSVCADAKACVVMSDRPSAVKTDVARRRYQWVTSEGPVVVSCKREYYLVGAWGCTAQPGQIERD